jgi:hypothetical protein
LVCVFNDEAFFKRLEEHDDYILAPLFGPPLPPLAALLVGSVLLAILGPRFLK